MDKARDRDRGSNHPHRSSVKVSRKGRHPPQKVDTRPACRPLSPIPDLSRQVTQVTRLSSHSDRSFKTSHSRGKDSKAATEQEQEDRPRPALHRMAGLPPCTNADSLNLSKTMLGSQRSSNSLSRAQTSHANASALPDSMRVRAWRPRPSPARLTDPPLVLDQRQSQSLRNPHRRDCQAAVGILNRTMAFSACPPWAIANPRATPSLTTTRAPGGSRSRRVILRGHRPSASRSSNSSHSSRSGPDPRNGSAIRRSHPNNPTPKILRRLGKVPV